MQPVASHQLAFRSEGASQDDPQYRLEIGAGIGTMAYEGDFNGSIFKNMQPMAALWDDIISTRTRSAAEYWLWQDKRIF